MFALTHQERKVLLFVGVLILAGSLLKFFNANLSQPSFKESAFQAKVVNVNTASARELEEIPGIGEKISRRIVDYRRQHGEFKTLDDLKRIKGIGEHKLGFIKGHIVF